jgi:type VI secretion system secreted protein VgrG
MTPKSGKAGSAVAPAETKAAEEADKADPGEVAEVKARQREQKAGKYGAEKVKPFKPPTKEEIKEKKLVWIEIQMVDEEGQPVTGEKYKIELSDGTVSEGTLGSDGKARLDGIEPGSCKVSFPDLDGEAWEKA